ncbi:MAG: hypothetical protein KDA96_05440, partial [Planctomycetaceae bacterium]|nr:hypothetical protein [Planctomycetaceae bacterium]
GSAAILIAGTGSGTAPGVQSNGAGTNFLGGTLATGDINLTTDGFDFQAGNLQSTGNLLIAPQTAATSIGIGSGTGTLSIDNTELPRLTDGFAGIVIGNATSGLVDLNSVAFSDPVTVVGSGISVDDAVFDVTNDFVTLEPRSGGTVVFENSGLGTFDGTITGAGGLSLLTGNTTLTGTSSFSGGTTIGAGATARVYAGSALGSGPITVAAGGFLSLNNDITVANDLTLQGVSGTGSLANTTGDNTYSGDITLTGNSGILVNPGTSLSVTGQISLSSGDLNVTSNGDITFDDVIAGGQAFEVDAAGQVIFDGTVTATGFGTVTVNTDRNISVSSGAAISVVDGDLTLAAAGTVNGDYIGLHVTGGSLATTGAGNISLQGKGGDDVTTSSHNGIRLIDGATVTSSQTTPGAGTITIDGTAGNSSNFRWGVLIKGNGTQVVSAAGDILITNQEVFYGGYNNAGVIIESGAVVQSTDGAAINLTGTGGTGVDGVNGVWIAGSGAKVTTSTGDISITGITGFATGQQNSGVYLTSGGLIESTAGGEISILGTGRASYQYNSGVRISGNAAINSNAGNVSITGDYSRNSGIYGGNVGVRLEAGGSVVTTGSAQILVNGTGAVGGSNNRGVEINNGTLSSVNGAVSVSGTAPDATGSGNHGVAVYGGGNAITTGTGGLSITGDAATSDPAVGVGISLASTGTVNLSLAGSPNVLNADSIELGAAGALDSSVLTVSADAFFVNGTLSSGFSVVSGQRLGGRGTVSGAVSAESGGTVAPGNSPGILNTGDFELQAGASLEIEIGGTSAGNTATDHDQVNVTGTVTLAGDLTAVRYNGFQPQAGDEIVIINNDGTDVVNGTFNGLAEGATFTSDTLTWTVSYSGGDGNDVVLTALWATFAVTNLNDSGAGSLHQALLNANTFAGADTITFNVAGSVPVSSAFPLPSLTEEVHIDATTAPGYAGSPVFELQGELAGNVSGLTFTSGSDGSVVKGLSITAFDQHGIDVQADSITISGNWIGLNLSGNADGNAQNGITVSAAAHNVTIGGTTSSERNVISANSRDGIEIRSTGVMVQGNYIGTDAAGLIAIGNSIEGIQLLDSSNNVIGGGAPGAGNVISGNNGRGISMTNSDGNKIQGNYIGVDATGNARMNNSGDGIQVSTGSDFNIIGTDGDGTNDSTEGNVLTGNSFHGINFTAGQYNVVAGNLIGLAADGDTAFYNGISGIQFQGSTAFNLIGTNEDGQSDTEERNTIVGSQGIWINNTAIHNQIVGNYIGTDVTGTQARGNNQGIRFTNSMGSTLVRGNLISGNTQIGASPGSGIGLPIGAVAWFEGEDATDSFASGNGAFQGDATTAAGIDNLALSFDGTGDFVDIPSAPELQLSSGDFTIEGWINPVSTNDGNVYTIIDKSADAATSVDYRLAIDSDGRLRLDVGGVAAPIHSTSAISAGEWTHVAVSQNQSTGDIRVYVGGRIETTSAVGASASSADNLLIGARRNSASVTDDYFNGLIDDVGVYSRALDAAEVLAIANAPGGNKQAALFQGNIIGLGADGNALPNGGNTGWHAGLHVSGSGVVLGGETPAARNVIAGNTANNVLLRGGTGNHVVVGNYIGVGADGSTSFGGSADGLEVVDGSSNNIIGGPGSFENVISGNGGPGIRINSSSNTRVSGNVIGLDSTGLTPVPNNSLFGSAAGIEIGSAANNVVIGTDSDGVDDGDEANVISGNDGAGIRVQSNSVTISGNFIGTDALGAMSLGNDGDGIYVIDAIPLIVDNVISGNAGDGIQITGDGNGIDSSAVLWLKGENNFTDATGQNDGTDIGGVGFAAGVGGGQAFSLNGSTQHIEVADSASLDVTTELSVDAWINPTALTGGNSAFYTIATKYDSQASAISWGIWAKTGGKLDFRVSSDGSTANTRIIETTNSVLTLGTFQHIAATFDATSQTARIYVNGVEVPTTVVQNVTVSSIANTTTPVRIGAFRNTSGNIVGHFDGLIDEPAIYNSVLSSSQITVLYSLNGSGKQGTVIQGNTIGLNAAGNTAVGNSHGIRIVGSPGNLIGGGEPGQGNIVSGNTNSGLSISLAASAGNLIQGNQIGTDITGTLDLGNTGDGILITDAATANVVQSNLIVNNTGNGIFIDDGSANIIGTDSNGVGDSSEGNILSGNQLYGLAVDGQSSTGNGNVIAGNIIGMEDDGATVNGNASGGIQIVHAQSTRIGTDGDGVSDMAESNLISGNSGPGVVISGHSASGNLIAGNFIGTDITGDLARGNTGTGVWIQNSNFNTVGGGLPGMGNVISANGTGVYIQNVTGHGKNNRIQGNIIGLNAAGDAALGNTGNGIESFAPDNSLNYFGTDGDGLNDAGEGNVISGNGQNGIGIYNGTSHIIAGNLIGTDTTGTLDLGNGRTGIVIGRNNNRIGTDADGTSDTLERNVISGNGEHGILFGGTAGNNVVAGNYIGTDATGLAAVPNDWTGITIGDQWVTTSNIIGGDDPAERNLISGNSSVGIYATRIGGTQIIGNSIGLDATGNALLPNGSASVPGLATFGSSRGIHFESAGTASIINNVIAGHVTQFVVQRSGAQTIQGNYFGTNLAGNVGLGGTTGISLSNNAAGTIGGGGVGEGNVFAGLTGTGVVVTGSVGDAGDHTIQGNLFGMDATGTDVIGLGHTAIWIQEIGAASHLELSRDMSHIVIGTDGDGVSDATEGNIIAGVINGIYMTGPGITDAVIAGNTIGLLGTNSGDGILIENGAPSNRIGTNGDGVSDALERNIISGNAGSGINLSNAGLLGTAGVWLRADGDATDSSNFSHHGTVLNGAGFGPGMTGQAFDLQTPTAGGVDPHTIQVTHIPEIGAKSISAAAWINLDVLPTTGETWTVLHKGITGNVGNYAIEISDDGSGNTEMAMTWYNGGWQRIATPVPSLTAGQFHHVAVTADGINVSLYLDGVLQSQQAQPAELLVNNHPLQIGANLPYGNRFDGRIDEIAIFRHALTANQVQSLYDAAGTGLGGGIQISGNFIGTDATGTAAVPNGTGITVQNRTSFAVIGTNGDGTGDAVEGNVISGNSENGIHLTGAGVEWNHIAGNFIGTNSTGTADLGNTLSGIRLYGATNTLIGTNHDGTGDAAERNVISGNDGIAGIEGWSADGTIIAGNLIGTNAGGTAEIGNSNGIYLEGGADIRIGGSQTSERNIVSGNDGTGIVLRSTGSSKIQGNYVGVDVTGSSALANGDLGVANAGKGIVLSTSASNNVIGTDGDGTGDATEGNVISGNILDGVVLEATSNTNTVAGNLIGLNATGTAGIANTRSGISIGDGAWGNLIGSNADGTSDAFERNVISGNTGNGVIIKGATTTENTIAGNFIGTNQAGTAGVGNSVGIQITDMASNNTVGGDSAADRNIIAGNGGDGILIT